MNRLEDDVRIGKAAILAAQLTRRDVASLDELGYLSSPALTTSCCSTYQQALRAHLSVIAINVALGKPSWRATR